jgi:diacylglycerol kinase (ATP)
MNRVVAVFNPMSRSGRAQKELPGLQALVDQMLGPLWGPVEWHPTRLPGDATIRAREAAIRGAELVLSVGGDGTHSSVLNGFLDDQGNPVNARSRIGIVHLGTGGDFRKSLGIGGSLQESLVAIARNNVRTIDIGKISFYGESGEKCSAFFMNIASAGIAGLVDRLVKRAVSKAIGGTAAFFEATVRSFFTYKNRSVKISIDHGPAETFAVCNLVVANGAFFGGGMRIAPNALLDDGHFQVVCLGDFSIVDFARHAHRLYDGSHLSLAKVWSRNAVTVTLESDRETLLDIDGEPMGRLPAEITLLPKKCPVIVGPSPLVQGVDVKQG